MSEDITMRLRGLSLFWGMPSFAEAADEIDRLHRHVDALQMKVSAESCACGYDSPDAVCLAHSPQLSAALADVERLTRERDEARAEVERLRAENELQRAEIELQRTSRHREARAFEAEHNRLQAALNTARRERDEALEEIRCLGLSEVLAKHSGSPSREWHSVGAWLYPGETINHVIRSPREEPEDRP